MRLKFHTSCLAGRLIPVLLIPIFLTGAFQNYTKAQSNHTVSFTGNTSDFNSTELYVAQGDNTVSYYITFDANNIYLGAFRTSGTFGSTDNFAVYIDSDPTSGLTTGTGTTAGQAYNGVTGTLPFSANYDVHAEESYQEARSFGSNWGSTIAGVTYKTSSTAREAEIPFSSIGSPNSLYITVWMGYSGGTWANAPGASVGGANPAIINYFGGFGVSSQGCTPTSVNNIPITDILTNGNPAAGSIYGKVNITSGTYSSSGSVTIASGGSINVLGGSLNLGSNNIIMSGGTTINQTAGTLTATLANVIFAGATSSTYAYGIGYFTGTVQAILNNVTINNGGVDFNAVAPASIAGILQINAHAYVMSAPIYSSGSLLKYNIGLPYGRYNEWSATSGAGYPWHVELSNNTALDLGKDAAGTPRQCAGNLTIDAGSSLSMATTPMTAALSVTGNFTNNGTFYPSTLVGGDLKLYGNFTNNNTFASNGSNGRSTGFYGTIPQTITTGSPTTFDYVDVNNSAGVTLGSLSSDTITINRQLQLSNGILTIGGANILKLACNYNVSMAGTIINTNYSGSISTIGTLGDFAPGAGAGTIVCQGNCDFTGIMHVNNIILKNSYDAYVQHTLYGAEFHSDIPANKTYINGILQLTQKSFIEEHPPYYNPGSMLEYKTNAEYWRWREWSTRSGAGYPYNVHIINTQLDLDHPTPDNTKDSVQCAGSVVIESTGGLRMDLIPMAYPLYVNGSITNNGSLVLSTLGLGDMVVKGNFTNNGTFIHNDRLTTFWGSGMQTINGTVTTTEFGYVKINNGAGVKLADNIRVKEQINLRNGILITTAADTVIIVPAAASIRTNGYVIGNITKQFSTGAQQFKYMLGTLNGYSPDSVSFANVSHAGSLNGTAVQSVQPNVPYSQYALTRYWKMTALKSLAFSTYNASFYYLSADFVAPFIETTFEAGMTWGKYNAGTGWIYPNVLTRNAGGNSILINNVTSFSDFTGFANTCASVTTDPAGISQCSGTSGSFTVAATGDIQSYAWQVNNGSWTALSNGGVYSNVNSASLNISNITGLNGYLYRCIVTGLCGSTVTSTAATLTVISAPNITSTTPGSRCDAGTVELGASSTGTLTWYGTLTGGISLGTGSSFTTPIISNTTTYYVDASGTGCTTSPRIAVTATVNVSPSAPVAGNGGNVCAGNTLNLTVSTISGATYSWAGPNGFTSALQNPSISNATTSATGTYSVTATVNGCNSTTAGTTAATVYAIPSAPTAGNGGSICAGSTLNLTALTISGATYSWAGPNGFTSALQNPSILNATTAATGTYSVTATVNGCASLTAGTTVATVNAIPTITGVMGATRCDAGTVTLNATASAGIINWYDVSSGGTILNTGTTFINSVISTATFYAEATAAGCATTTRTPVTATVNITPSVTGTTPGSRCDGGTVVLGATSSAGTINWYNVSTGGSILASGTTYTTQSISSTTNYYIELTTGVCTTATRTAVLATINTTPSVAGTTPGSRCDVGTVVLGATSSAGTISWYDVLTGGSSIGTGNSFTSPSISSTTTYYAEATANGCINPIRTAVTATVNATPSIMNVSPAARCDAGSVTLNATESAGNINWYNNLTGGSIINTGNAYITTISSTSTFYIEATAAGCTTATRTAITATVTTTPVITGVMPASRCDAGIISLNTTTSAGTINWYTTSSGGSSIATGPTYSPYVSLTINYYADATLNNCTTTSRTAVTATVTTTPVITSVMPASRCDAGIISLNATTSTGTINWYTTLIGGSSIATGSSYSPYVSSTINYYADATLNNCTTTSRTAVTATVNTTPIITGVMPASRCDAGSVTLNATSSAGAINWYTTAIGGSSVATGSSYSPYISSTTNYYADATSNGCTTPTRTEISATVNISASSSNPVSDTKCLGQSAGFFVNALGTLPIMYQWQLNGVNIANATNSNYSISSANTIDGGSYTCIVSNQCNSITTNVAIFTVNTQPTITDPLSETKCLGQGSSFTVSAGGNPSPIFQWQKNGINIIDATNSSYVISSINPADAGNYSCIASNVCTSATSNNAVLTVNASPLITSNPLSQNVLEGQGCTFSVIVSGSNLSYQWQMNNVNISNTGVFAGADTSVLNISDVTGLSGNSFTCIISGSCYPPDSTIAAILTVSLKCIAPGVSNQPTGGTICDGSTATFTVAPDGTSPFTYQWYKNSNLISGATINTLTLNNVKSSDAGSYQCSVNNACGNIMTNGASLNINLQPIILSRLADETQCPGTNYIYIISAQGTGPISYQWYRDGIAISNATNTIFTLYDLSTSDDANYFCVVTNICNSKTSDNSYLSIVIPPKFSSITPNTFKCSNDSILFKTAVTGGISNYQWYKGNVLISGATAGNYYIKNLLPADSGNYSCHTINLCGNDFANSILNVGSTPVITNTLTNQARCENDNITFSLYISGNSLTSYQWTKSGNSILGGTNSSYTISLISMNDMDLYSCQLKNSCGTSTLKPFILSVIQKPGIHIQPITQSGYVGDSLIYTLSPTGAPPFTYQWLLNGNPINGASKNIYSVKHVTLDDSGNYSCLVSNQCGTISAVIGTFTVINQSGYTIHGIVKYDNTAQTPLSNTKVYIETTEGIKIDSTDTDIAGNYVFNYVSNGTYILDCKTTLNWSGVNPLDALLINRYYIQIYSFVDNMRMTAADVNNDKKYNPLDALFINRRYVGMISKFTIPDWLFSKPTVTISDSSVNQDIIGICAGDVNGSYSK